jgi:hypothetical protein
MLIDDKELALSYLELPWFKAATLQQILNMLRPTSDHLYWPDLDVDLSVESNRRPERFALRAGREPIALPKTSLHLTRLLQLSELTKARIP